jgi:Fic family protein
LPIPIARAEAEAKNGIRQFDAVVELIDYFLSPDRKVRLRPSHLLHLHRIALEGISSYAGNYRPAGIEIHGSRHQPVGAHLVPGEIEEMCDYVNEKWNGSSPLHLAAYALWKLNWIHPFTDGNGRTARALSYLLLCARLGYRLPGKNTIPEQIAADKAPYYKALEAADKEWADRKVDLSVPSRNYSRICSPISWYPSTMRPQGRSGCSSGRSLRDTVPFLGSLRHD